MIELGTQAPDFKLKDQEGKTFQQSELENQKVLLSFHPLAWTDVCANQMKALEENLDKLGSLNVVPLGISVDSTPSKKAWAESLGIKKLRMLADFWPHGDVAKSYGIFREEDGFSERANILVNEARQVIFCKIYPIAEVPNIDEIFELLNKQRFMFR
jgi:peroxiredoxin